MSAACPEYGFVVAARVVPGADGERLHAEFIAMLEHEGLCAGGGTDDDAWHLAITRVGSQATDDDRHLLLAWFEERAGRLSATVSDLVDLETLTS
ncbi:MAG: 50S ribosome-binding protein YggL [Gemmatimonadaceae bacterium]